MIPEYDENGDKIKYALKFTLNGREPVMSDYGQV